MTPEKIMIVALAILAGMIVNRMMNVEHMLDSMAA
jgi:hypothetical protein